MASVIAITVSPLSKTPSTPETRRRITPSAGQSTSKHVLILTPTKGSKISSLPPSALSPGKFVSTKPFFASKLLFPDAVGRITHQYTDTRVQGSSDRYDDKNPRWHVRHVLLPFDLRDPNIRIVSTEVQDYLRCLFPGTYNVVGGRYRSHLMFQVDALPRGSWPQTVGGLPITIFDDAGRGRASMFSRQELGYPRVSLFAHRRITLFSAEGFVKWGDIRKQFQRNLPAVIVLEIMYTRERTFFIVLEDPMVVSSMRSRLPGLIAQYPVGYIHLRDFCRPLPSELSAKRLIEPRPSLKVVDNTAYNTLRPGVQVCSKKMRDPANTAVFSATSGVLVKNDAGDVFVTCASHGIGADGLIWQGEARDRIIGEAKVQISYTGVALVQLNKDVQYVNETFADDTGMVPQFKRLLTSDEKVGWPLCSLNSCYSGSMQGSLIAQSVKFPDNHNMSAIVYNWMYTNSSEMENPEGKIPDGICGSAIWDDDGRIMGFFEYYINSGPWKDMCCSVNASEVLKAGYRLA